MWLLVREGGVATTREGVWLLPGKECGYYQGRSVATTREGVWLLPGKGVWLLLGKGCGYYQGRGVATTREGGVATTREGGVATTREGGVATTREGVWLLPATYTSSALQTKTCCAGHLVLLLTAIVRATLLHSSIGY